MRHGRRLAAAADRHVADADHRAAPAACANRDGPHTRRGAYGRRRRKATGMGMRRSTASRDLRLGARVSLLILLTIRTAGLLRPAAGSSCAIAAIVRSRAPWLASRIACAARPSACLLAASASRSRNAASSSHSSRTCTRGARIEERRGNLLEVLHVRPEQDRPAVHGRLQDVVAAGRNQAAADEHDRRPAGRGAPVHRWSRAPRRRRPGPRRSSTASGAASGTPRRAPGARPRRSAPGAAGR